MTVTVVSDRVSCYRMSRLNWLGCAVDVVFGTASRIARVSVRVVSCLFLFIFLVLFFFVIFLFFFFFLSFLYIYIYQNFRAKSQHENTRFQEPIL